MLKKNWLGIALILSLPVGAACDSRPVTSDSKQRIQQEVLLNEATNAVGMPNIKNFRERKILKDILELRDQDGLVTYTYVWSDVTAKPVFLCNSIGYGIPYATQYTNPQKTELAYDHAGTTSVVLAQADPNGLFSPANAEGTWVLCKNPNGDDVRPIYVEPRIVVTPFKLDVIPQ